MKIISKDSKYTKEGQYFQIYHITRKFNYCHYYKLNSNYHLKNRIPLTKQTIQSFAIIINNIVWPGALMCPTLLSLSFAF